MKNLTLLKSVFSLLFFLWFSISSYSQTGNCTVLQQPCDSDGVLVTTVTSGLTLPLNFTYWNSYYNIIVLTNTNVNVMSDTVTGISYIDNVKVTDNYGHTLWLNSGMVLPLTANSIITQPVCPDTVGSVTITINGGNPPAAVDYYSYNSGAYFGSGNPMDLPTGDYYCIVSDQNGCNIVYGDTIVPYITIYQANSIHFTISHTVAGCTDGTAAIHNVTGAVSSSYSYHWSSGMTTDSISNLVQGYYAVTITDSIGCQGVNGVYVNQSINIGVNPVVTQTSCLQNDGSIITFGSGGQPPYSYVYSNGAHTQENTGLTSGYYHVTVTDANGCYGIGGVQVGTSSPITVTYTVDSSSCTSPTGGAFLSISGGQPPYNISWAGYPAQTDTFLINVPVGNYHFSVTDQNGCSRDGTVHIPDVGNLSANILVPTGSCSSSNAVLTANVSGNNPPFSFLWNTGAITQSISGIPSGNYTVTITDALGCSVVKNQHFYYLLPVGFSSQNASCLFTPDGKITANVIGGTPPFHYSWSYYNYNYIGLNLPTSFPDTNVLSGLYQGLYFLETTDAMGCSSIYLVYLDYNHSNDSCYCTVTGRVYVDENNNCTYDAGEETVQNIMIHLDSLGYTFTDTAGVYSFKVPVGNFTLSEVVQYYYPLSSCQNNQINLNINPASGCTLTYDFANVINPIHDLMLITPNCEYPVVGDNYYQRIVVVNAGTVTEDSIQIGYEHDGQLTFINSSLSSFSQNNPGSYPNWYSVNTGFPSLDPGYYYSGFINYFVPTNIPLGTDVHFRDTVAYDTMSNWLNDYSPWNNINDFYATTVASYDPNFKEVFPQGVGTQGYITTDDSVLTYIIHFENTGTYYAEKVVIVDTIDSNLDITTIRPLFSSHNFRADVNESGILIFTFDNIHLPYYSDASRGVIAFSVKQKPSLSAGTVINNRASIFFDYNQPVVTNTVINTITTEINIFEQSRDQDILLYPNPASSTIWIHSGNVKDILSYTIYDLTGRVVVNNKMITSPEVNISNLQNGLYFIEITDKNGNKKVTKFVKN